MIYLDNAATTMPDPIVVDTMTKYQSSMYGNPGAVYPFGKLAADAVRKARRQVAEFLRCTPEQIIFTSGGSEANSAVLLGLSDHLQLSGRSDVIVSAVEHDSVIRAATRLEQLGFRVRYLPVNPEGVVSPEELEEMISEQTGLVSVMSVNNETGSVNDVEKLAEICHKYGALFHTDCVQAAAAFPIDVSQIGCDFLSLSSHKLHGPKGVGAVFARDKALLSPIIFGGDEQEFGLRGGTENVPGIAGFGKACEIYLEDTGLTDVASVRNLASAFYKNLKARLHEKGMGGILHLNGQSLSENPRKIVNVRLDGIDSETMLLALGSNALCVSAGSACRSHASEPSRVLTQMGLSADQARNSMRISFSKFNTVLEAMEAARVVANCAFLIRNIEGEE